MKKVKIQDVKPIGIYGGEPSGANPLDWTLRSTITAQLRALGWECSVDRFGDGSGSWIEVFKEKPSDKKLGKVSSFTIQFNDAGTIIQNIRFFEQTAYVALSETKLIL